MKKVVSAVAVLAIVASALAFTAKKTQFEILLCDPDTETCTELVVNSIGVGPVLEGNQTFNAIALGEPCPGACDQTVQAIPEF